MNVYSFNISLLEANQLDKKIHQYLVSSPSIYVKSSYSLNGATINIYESGKCVVQGKKSKELMNEYFPVHLKEIEKLEIQEANFHDQNIIDVFSNHLYEVGSDEVGVGDYFGGLVVCSCMITQDQVSTLKEWGVNDSKKISDSKILEIAPKLIKYIKYDVKEIYPINYNKLFNEFKNTHVIKTFMHNAALSSLLKDVNIKDCFVILDEYASEKNYSEYLKILNRDTNISIDLFLPKAESHYLSVACASIIARYYFLRQIKKLSKQLNIEIPLGAWNPKIETTAKFLKENYGPGKLKEFLKLHFKNTNKI